MTLQISESSQPKPPADDVISVSSTESSVSLQIVDEVEVAQAQEGEKEMGTARSAFESLQNTVYSEACFDRCLLFVEL